MVSSGFTSGVPKKKSMPTDSTVTSSIEARAHGAGELAEDDLQVGERRRQQQPDRADRFSSA